MIINWDQTAIKYVLVSNWTMADERFQRVEVVAASDKRQITSVFGITLSGDFLPPQLIYQGTTPKCLPSIRFPAGRDITFSNHWSNESTMEDYLSKILFPYIVNMRAKNQLDVTHPALVIYDTFRGQCTQTILTVLEENNVYIVIVPANCTDHLQPLDLSVNKAAKKFLRKQFTKWYSYQICQQLRRDIKPAKVINLQLSIMKTLGAQWMINLKSKPDISKNGFKEAGITFTQHDLPCDIPYIAMVNCMYIYV